MSLTTAGKRLAVEALSGEASLRSGSVEIREAGRQPVDFTPDVPQPLSFGPAVRDWWVTDVLIRRDGSDVLLHPLDESLMVHAGQRLDMSLTLTAEI